MDQQRGGERASAAAEAEEGRPAGAVLFDLDGTLLDIDGEGFLDAYVDALASWWGPADGAAFRQAVMAASVPIFRPHPGRPNGDVFRHHLGAHLGIAPDEVARRMARFHDEALPRLRFPRRPVPEARGCVQECLEAGWRVVVATTPIYRPEVIDMRLRWAGLDDLPWDLVTHSELMSTCKPSAAYFAETAALLDLPPARCVMVGDDPLQDGPAIEVGMPALLRRTAHAPGWGTLRDVAAVVTGGHVMAAGATGP
jgi:FMN phosphatase YigB (HAD superfamily)